MGDPQCKWPRGGGQRAGCSPAACWVVMLRAGVTGLQGMASSRRTLFSVRPAGTGSKDTREGKAAPPLSSAGACQVCQRLTCKLPAHVLWAAWLTVCADGDGHRAPFGSVSPARATEWCEGDRDQSRARKGSVRLPQQQA